VPVAEIGDQRIRFSDTGGDGPPIMFCHDHLDDPGAFAAQVGDLADVYRVITWDSRAATSPPADGDRFTYWDMASDLFGLLDVLGIERAVLVGAGQGADLSVRAALAHPDRVRALVLIDACLPPTHEHPRLDRDDVTDRLTEISSPVLVVHGSDDADCPTVRAKWLAACVADCRGIVEVAGAAAGSPRTHAPAVTGALREFLERLPA